MRVIAVKTLREFWRANSDAEQPLKAWFEEAQTAEWQTPNDIKAKYRSASILKNGRVVFNIAGNKYRLIVAILYNSQVVLIKFIGSHTNYDQIDAQTIDQTTRG